MDSLKNNLDTILNNIKEACKKTSNTPEDIILVGVTKTIDVDRIKQLTALGVNNLGENKVQELLTKYDYFDKKVSWHLIGHLQTNKVKYIMDKVRLIHSVDSFKLASEINKRAVQNNIVMDILIELNIADEESKFGLKEEELFEFVNSLKDLNNICIKGIMTVAPYVSNPEENRPVFKKMNDLFLKLKNLKNTNMDIKYLSMGMTNDYFVAIEEGANIVRIGTALFGDRKYNV